MYHFQFMGSSRQVTLLSPFEERECFQMGVLNFKQKIKEKQTSFRHLPDLKSEQHEQNKFLTSAACVVEIFKM